MWEKSLSLYEDYLLLERAVSAKTLHEYTKDAEQLIHFLSHILCIESPFKVTLDNLSDYIEYMHDELFYAGSTMSRKISSMKQYFFVFASEYDLAYNPAEHISRPKKAFKLPRVLNYDQVDLFFEYIDTTTTVGIRNRAIIELLYSCGMRVNELLELKVDDVKMEEDIIIITKGKGGKQRLAPISRTASRWVQIYLGEVRSYFETDDDRLFLSDRGKSLYQSNIDAFIRKSGKKLQIPFPVSTHTWRHTFATHMIMGGADLLTLRDILGHTSITTTEIYLHMDVEHLRRVLEKYHPRF